MDNEEGGDPIGLAVNMNYGRERITGDFITNFIKTMNSMEIKNYLIVAPTNPKNNQTDADKHAISMVELQENLKI